MPTPTIPVHDVEFVAAMPVDKLRIPSDGTQRTVIERHLRRLTSEWRTELCEPLAVCPDPDGRHSVIEGMHRLLAAQANEIEALPVVIHHLEDLGDRMALHYSLQGAKVADSAFDKYRFRAESGHFPDFAAADDGLQERGLSVTDSTATSNSLACAGAISTSVDQHGPDPILHAVDVLEAAFGRSATTWQAYAVAGVAELLARYPTVIDDRAKLADKMRLEWGGADALIAEMNRRVKGTGGSGSRKLTVARIVAETWNRRVRTESRRIPDDFLGIIRDEDEG